MVRVGDYLIERLRAHGVEHVFGVPGDFVLGFMKELEASPLALITTCDEQGAGFAADAYARLRGLGVVCVTYGVGGLKVANTTGQAYAEESPVLVISGAPSLAERKRHPLIHHKVRTYDTQLRVFKHLTAAAAILGEAVTYWADLNIGKAGDWQSLVSRLGDRGLQGDRWPDLVAQDRGYLNDPWTPA